MQNEDEQLKNDRGGEKVTWSGKARLWSSAVVEGGGDSGCASSPRRNDTSVCVFYSSRQFALPIFPSLRLSPLLVSVFPVNFLLLLFFLPSLPLFSSQPSPLLLRGSQRRSGVLWRWRAGTVAGCGCCSSIFLFCFGFLLCWWSCLLFLSASLSIYLPGFLVSTVSVPSLPSFCFSQKNCCFPPFGLSFLSQKKKLSDSLSLGFPPLSFSKQNPSSSPSFSPLPSFLSCTPSVFIGRGSEGHPALPSHGRAWWQHGGGYCTAALASALCMVWPFWREGVVVSVKGQVGALVFWVLGERERIKKMGGKMLLLPLFSACPGEEEGLWCRSKRHRLLLFFFFAVKRMKRRRFDQNTQFHLNKNWRRKEFNFRSALHFARFFTMVLGFGFLQSSP